MDQVESGKTELFPVVQSFIPGAQAKSFTATDEIRWVKENKEEFKDLKEYVLSKGKL
ncbi:hypothetical protein [Paenibacillus sp. NPDC057934]|uniref:hypothetical protein n=1 Tax=Paenibacillus sp. NPDC057934 TaxID=3346282 RepID=UPI0036D9A83E